MAKKVEERIKPKYPARTPGRPPELTTEIIDTVIKSLLVGNYFETAIASAGFHKDTGYDWLKKGARDSDSIYKQFSDAVRKAEADSEARDVMLIEMAAHGAKAQFDALGNIIRSEIPRDPKIAMWRLERKHPKRWARTDRHEVTGKDGGPLTFTDLIKELAEGDE